jgi:predicted alpha/beta hydrolase family esterase
VSNPNVILVHGNGGSTVEDTWFPEVKSGLEAVGIEVVAQTMPDNEKAQAHIWLPFLEDVLGANENSIIVGHSSGAVAAMRYAETHHIFGSVIVGASYTDLGIYSERRSGYFREPWNWDAIKANQNWVVQFASTDDPYIPIEEPRHIHEKLDTDYHEHTNKRHFTDFWFPELVTVIKEKLV